MQITWRRIALEDLDEAHGYIAEHNPDAADRSHNAILGAVLRLAEFPDLGRSGRVDGTRELVVSGTDYIVVYRLMNNQLMVLAVLHGAQDWPERF